MSVIWIEGFDLYNNAAQMSRRGYTGQPGSPNNLTTGRFGGQCWAADSNANPFYIPLGSALSTISMGFAVKYNSINGNHSTGKAIASFINGGSSGTVECKLGVDQNGAVKFGRGDFTTNNIVSSANGVITAGSWYYIEIELTRSASVGVINIYVGGTLVANLSSTNTGAADIDTIGMTMESVFDNRYLDDLYVTNTATRLGEMRVETIRPDSDDTVQFTPNSGANNYSRVNDTTYDDDSTYNSDATVGHKDLFNMSDLATTPSAIAAVQTHICARKDDATTRALRSNMKNGSTTSNGATQSMSSSYTSWVDIYNTNPSTSAAFTGSDVNAMKLGYEVVT